MEKLKFNPDIRRTDRISLHPEHSCPGGWSGKHNWDAGRVDGSVGTGLEYTCYDCPASKVIKPKLAKVEWYDGDRLVATENLIR